MTTEIQAIQSARQQFRAAFRQMAATGQRYDLTAGTCGPVLAPRGDLPGAVLVADVQGMAEQTMVNALAAAWKRNT